MCGSRWSPPALIAVLAYGDIRIATRSLLGLEGISVTLIVILMIVIVVKLIAGTAPATRRSRPTPSSCLRGTTFSARGQRVGVRIPVVRGASRAPHRWARRPTTRAVRSRGRSATRCSAAGSSTSSASPSRRGASAPTQPASRPSPRRARRSAISRTATWGRGCPKRSTSGRRSARSPAASAATAAGARILFALSRDTASAARSGARRRAPARPPAR